MPFRLSYLFPRVLSCLVLGVAAMVAVADDAPVATGPTIDQLKQQIAAHQYPQAWDTAQALRADNEGEPTYDLLFGIAAYENRHYYEAQYALERVVYAEPENMYARFVLAKTYQQLGDTGSAQREFKLVQASNPPADVAHEVDHYLSGKDHKVLKSSFIGYVEANVGHDNNINRGSSMDVVTLPWFYFTPPQPVIAAGRQQSDMYDSFIANLQYFQPLKDDLGIIGKFRASEKNYFSGSQFDETIYDLSASINQKLGDHLLKLTVFGQNYRLDGASRTNTVGGDGTWQYQVLKNTSVSAGLGASQLRYPGGNGLLDVDQQSVHGAVSQHIGNQYHTIGIIKTDESAVYNDGDYNARDSLIVYYDLNWYLSMRNSLQLRILRENIDHGAQDPVWLVNRTDNLRDVYIAWQWRYDNHILWNTRVGASRNDSNLDVYEYSRAYIETGIRYAF